MAEPTPFEKLIEELALIIVFIVFGILFLVAAAIILLSKPIAVIVAAFSAYMLYLAAEGKLF
jgi:uncharacterized membrane protein